jgi:hypothetical protein
VSVGEGDGGIVAERERRDDVNLRVGGAGDVRIGFEELRI